MSNVTPINHDEPPEEKYVVIKLEDLSVFTHRESAVGGVIADGKSRRFSEALHDIILDDCWVIRKRDIHAAPSVFAYAQSVQNTIEFMAMLAEVNGASFDDEDVNGLTAARDAAQAFAEDALATRVKKLPS